MITLLVSNEKMLNIQAFRVQPFLPLRMPTSTLGVPGQSIAMATATVVQASSDDSETSPKKEGKHKDVMAILRKKGAAVFESSIEQVVEVAPDFGSVLDGGGGRRSLVIDGLCWWCVLGCWWCPPWQG